MISRLLFLAFVVHSSNSLTKVWKSERSRSGWLNKGTDLRCSEHSLVYQPSGTIENQIPFTAKSSIERIALPEYGAIVIQDTDPIALDYDPHSSCPAGWQNYRQQAVKPAQSWFSPDMWTVEGEKFNAAKPHIDRIPCECDTASIASDGTMSMSLDGMSQVVVGAVRINGQTGSLQQLLNTQMGSMMLDASTTTAFEAMCEPHRVDCGCHSPRRIFTVTQAVCDHVHCPEAACESPVRPIGHCCHICGATLQLRLNSCRDVPHLNVEDQLSGVLLQNKPERKLLTQVQMYENFYANPDTTNTVDRYIFQVVIVDRGNSYEEFSTQMATVAMQYFPNFQMTNSGRPQTPGATSPFWIIVLGTLSLITAVYALIYAYYEKQLFGGPNRTSGRFSFLANSPFSFSRFDNVSMSGGMATIVTSGRDSAIPDGATTGVVDGGDDSQPPGVVEERTSFDNPMFKVKQPASAFVDVIETIGPNVLNETATGGVDDMSCSSPNDIGMECENLVDVSLES